MINRELIRLKVVQLIYAYYRNEGKTTEIAEKELEFSLDKAYELYEYLLTLLVEMRKLAERRDETARARSKRLGTAMQGCSPDGQFAANRLLRQLEENKALLDYRENKKQDWIEEEVFVKKLYTQFVESDTFQMYLTKEDFGYAADRELIRKLYKTFVDGNEDFDALLEEHSLYWNDDKEIVDSFVLKTIKRFNEETTPEQPLLPKYASEDDHEFALRLFRATIDRGEEIRTLLKDNCKNWKFERLAVMDVIIMQIALAEILTFPGIPVNVSFNEYLDIAKVYSTPRSASYINGLLDFVVKKLKSENVILK